MTIPDGWFIRIRTPLSQSVRGATDTQLSLQPNPRMQCVPDTGLQCNSILDHIKPGFEL